MEPILVPCLVGLRTEFDRLAPGRDKGADGWIGDAAHQRESSDHNPDETGRTPYSDADSVNEVHAIDIDKDLGGGLDLDVYVERIRLNHFHAEDDRLQNIIWRGRIASRSWGWTWRPYTGLSQHFDHAHFSARYTTAQEADIRPWGVYEEDTMPLTPADLDAVQARVEAAILAVIKDGYEAAQGLASADTKEARAKRWVRDALRKILGGPVDQAAIVAAVKAGDLDEAEVAQLVLAGLSGPEASAEQVAEALRTVLGDRAAEVGRVLAAAGS